MNKINLTCPSCPADCNEDAPCKYPACIHTDELFNQLLEWYQQTKECYWRDVNDELPEIGQYVYTKCNLDENGEFSLMNACEYKLPKDEGSTRNYFEDMQSGEDVPVTHWVPIPTPSTNHEPNKGERDDVCFIS